MSNYQLIQGDCSELLQQLPDNSIDLLITSPPYYNARDYIHYQSYDEYLHKMRSVFTITFDKLKNYHMCVINVGDVIGLAGKSKSTSKKFSISANFTIFMQEIGFRYIDDIIWDKGEVQSKRNFVGKNYPYQKYPINAYEHILVFQKIDNTVPRPKCPICNQSQSRVNGINNGIITYECANPDCIKSKTGRGKRYSEFQNMKNNYQIDENKISLDIIEKWRRDIVEISPVKKINLNGENILGHTAPFPLEIPLWAISYYSGINDTVLDCFMGSGTTGVACMKLNRNFIGMELQEEYLKVSTKRIEEINAKVGAEHE